MATKLHWGAFGSYKTSGALQDDVIPAVLKGRPVVTNVRGFTLDRVREVYPEVPEDAQIINIDTDTEDGLDRVRKWFHWAPFGALMVFDEAQLLFPASWRASDLAEFDYPGGIDQAKADNRPYNWEDAWTRQRHRKFDVILTTPSITLLRKDIRAWAEAAYYHLNLGLVSQFWPFKGRYRETLHNASENKPSAGAMSATKKINEKTFACYESTATGQVSDTIAGINIFRTPKIMVLLFVIFACFALILDGGGADWLFAENKLEALLQSSGAPKVAAQTTVEAQQTGQNHTQVSSHSAVNHGGLAVSHRPDNQANSLESNLLKGFDIRIDADISEGRKRYYMFSASAEGYSSFTLSEYDLELAGYQVIRKTSCLALLVHAGGGFPVTCSRRLDKSTDTVDTKLL
ncbi:zonular occludens toxin domain-containing protein [Zooshikella ganghwensis]|uniref:zonular occludens toxin domain-containing protein n=1 Tax=Zooshikella ganghwensis TaxID=202772 RepID=UPI0004098E27|nr:zonular occludens toxin domain-containing protein [Zooshikella ganghwensis]